MPPDHRDWNELTRSIHANRASNALFYKPVCVVAAIDLADAGGLVSDMLYAELIIRKFEQYVSIVFPKRASKGWWPLWFLANDGLWNFSKKGKLLSKADLAIRPTTKNKTLQRFDRQAISPEYRQLWDSAGQRKILRDHMLGIMNRYAESKLLVRALFDPMVTDQPDSWPDQASVDAYFAERSGQYGLFPELEPEQAVAKIRSAAAVRKALSAFDISSLPPLSSVGPSLELTGSAPIAITPEVNREVTQDQAVLYAVLLQKCLELDRLTTNSNRAAHLRPALEKLISALDCPPAQSNGYLIWSFGNTLRRLQVAELRARDAKDPEDPPLSERVGELLSDVVDQYNVYATTDHLVTLLDRARTGPAGRSILAGPFDAGSELVDALRAAPNILAPSATQILEVATRNGESAKSMVGIDAEQAVVNAVEIQRNTAGGILRNAVLEIRKLSGKAFSALKPVSEGMMKQVGEQIAINLPISYFVNSARDLFINLWQGTAGSHLVSDLLTLIQEFFINFRH